MTFREKIYTLREEVTEGVTHYFISFKDGQDEPHEVEVSHAVYSEFIAFRKINRNLEGFNERHKEYSELSDETLSRRAKRTPKSVEETVLDMERSAALNQAITKLPEIQRRRFILYCEYDMTYAAIGRLEGCSATSIKDSVDRAKAKIKKKLEVYT